jgi:hypothetical protein
MFWTPANFFWEQPFTPKAGLMPHPERASEPALGSDDCKWILESTFAALKNKTVAQTASEQSNILPTVLAKSPSSISQTPSAKLKTCGTVSRKSADAHKCQTVSVKSPVAISATPLRKLDAKQIVQTLSGKSSMLAFRKALESRIEKTRRMHQK